MTTESGAPAGLSPAPADDGVSALTIEDARAMIDRMPDEEDTEQPAKAAEAPAEPKSAPEVDADPEEAPRDDAEADDPEEEKLPSIEPPRSWTQAEKERFNSLPRETQEYLSHREQERETALRRSQNELAEQRKAIEAERQAAEKVRQQYEAAAKEAENALLRSQNDRFPDIKSWDDYQRLSRSARELVQTDPFKALEIQAYLQDFDTHQRDLQIASNASKEADARKEQEQQSNWMKHVQEENAKAIEFIPDLADKTKGEALTKRVATELLPDLGFKDSELADLANGKQKLSIYDHRIQRLLADSLKLRDIQSAPKAVVKPTLPPVQKPGHAGAVNSTDANIKALEKRFNASGSLEDGWALHEARLKSTQRRAS